MSSARSRGNSGVAVLGTSAIVISHDGRTAYLIDGSVIASIHLRTGTAGRRIVIPQLAMDSFSIATGGRTACVTGTTITASGLGEHQAIELVDLTTSKTGKRIAVANLLGAALAPDGRTAYAASGNMLLPLDLATGTAGQPIRTPMLAIGAIVIAPDGRTAYVAAYSSVIPIDLTTSKAARPIPMPDGIHAIVLAP